jgi:hypothetical protein
MFQFRRVVSSVFARCSHGVRTLFARRNHFQEVAYYSIKTVTGLVVLLELTFKQGVNGCKVCVKTEQPQIAPLTQQCVEQILKSA